MEIESKHSKRVQLDFFEELIGRFVEIKQHKKHVYLRIKVDEETKELRYPIQSREGQKLLEECQDKPEGKKIGVLKTDLSDQPIIVREIKKTEVK